MKKIIYFLMSLIVIAIVFAQGQPDLLSTLQLESATSPPVAPGTSGGTIPESECTPFVEFKDTSCNEDIRIFTGCVKRVVNGEEVGRWLPQTQDCSEQVGVVCHNGACVREEDITTLGGFNTQTLIIIGVILFGLFMVFGRKRK